MKAPTASRKTAIAERTRCPRNSSKCDQKDMASCPSSLFICCFVFALKMIFFGVLIYYRKIKPGCVSLRNKSLDINKIYQISVFR